MMETYFRGFVNWEQDDYTKLLPIREFTYNNAKIASTGHILFELNCGYHLKMFFEEDINSYSKSYSTNKLAKKLRELIEICYQNLLHTQELQKRAHDKGVKSRSYVLSKKIWLNSKYSKTKSIKKFKSKFFRLF